MKGVLFCCGLIAGLAAPAPSQGATAADFQEGFKGVLRLMDRREWNPAYAVLQKLLAEHRAADYVRNKRVEIEEAVRKCAFYKEADVPKLGDLISGELVDWSEATGELKLRYRMKSPKALDDFERAGSGGWVHPVIFKGPYSIELKGNAYPELTGQQPLLVAGFQDDQIFRAGFGGSAEKLAYRASLDRIEGEENESLDGIRVGPGEPGRKFTVRMEVGHSLITAYYNNRRVLSGKKDRSIFGRVGFAGFPQGSIREIVIRGEAQGSWLQNLEDAAVAGARVRFEAQYRPEDHLPAWLLEEGAADHFSVREHAALAVPEPPLPSQEPYVREAFGYFERQEYEEGLAYLRKLKPGLMTKPALDYLSAEFLYALQRYAEAEACFRRSQQADPEFVGNRLLHARFVGRNASEEAAIAEYVGILRDYPREATVCAEYAQMLLRAGRQREAKSVVDAGLARGMNPAGLERINRLLVKAMNGPQWERAYERASEHYHVYSDLDQEVCNDASKVLEEAYRAYTHHLEQVKGASRETFRVYIFSGKASYEDYIRDLMGYTPESSAGVYIPILKQLLIWNLPDRETMMQTVRHEGFHQYLDSLVREAPTWFNEGMAEYYELADRVKGRWSEGAINRDHLRVLRDEGTRLYFLAEFLRMDADAFYADGRVTYPEAWGFVHFLRHGSRDSQRLFDRMMRELVNGTSAQEAVERVFGRADLRELQDEFAEYLRALK